jgi:hypothetical protein
MQNAVEPVETMTNNEVFAAVQNLKKKLEENFVTLGQLLSMIKRKKMFRTKGYDSFKDFIEAEYNINSTLANKLVSVYDVFVTDLDVDDTTVKELGLDRLNMIRPYVKEGYPMADEWLQLAEKMPVNELKEHIKQLKSKEKEQEKDVKDVLIDQFMEKMRTWFNCSAKELNFKLALYFQDADLEDVKKVVKVKQRQFEEETHATKEVDE